MASAPSLTRRFALAVTLLWAAHRALFPLSETDLFFHLKLGEIILAERHIPFRNLFSFTYPLHPDPDLAWGFQVLMALTHRSGGFAAIVASKVALVVTATAVLWRAATRRGAPPATTMVALVMALEAARPRLVERPHLVTFVGLALLLLLLAGIEERPRRWWWLPLVTLGWAQLHAGVFFCPLVLALWAAGAALEGVALPWRRVAATGGLCVAATLATPAGTRLPAYLLWHTGLGATRAVDEFRHADGWNDPWFFLLLAIGSTIAVAVRPRRWRDILPLTLVALLAWRSVRFVAEWALLAAPFLASGLGRLTPPGWLRAPITAVAALALMMLVVAERAAGRPESLTLPALAADVVPFDAIDFVTRTGLRRRMFNDLDVGCYLAWEGWPRWSVFEDARLPAYPDEFHRALDETPLAPPAFDALLARYGVDAALLADPATNRRVASFAPDEWALVWRRPAALVFARRTREHAAVIAAHEIPLTVELGGGARALWTPPARSPVPRCQWDLRLASALAADGEADRALDARFDALERGCLDADDEAEARFYRGARRQRAGDLVGAAADYDRVLERRPDDARALVNRGFARLRRDPAAARADLERARVLAPERAAEIARALALIDGGH